MPDDSISPQDQAAAAASIGSSQSMFSSTLTIPEEVKTQFPELLELIVHSESMNDEERQYWINILLIMTPDQIKNLQDILTNERQQLAAIDAKYEKEIGQVGQEQFLKQVGEERKARAEQRSSAEEQAKANETNSAEDLLKQIEGS